MKRFLIDTSWVLFVTIVVITGVSVMCDGCSDPYYLRLTTPQQSSLIIGSSRAAVGLRPDAMKEILGRSLYNYSFTLKHSPYGGVYNESILKKLSRADTCGIFVLEVNPWSVSSKTTDPNDSLNFRENGSFLASIKHVDKNPNFAYILKHSPGWLTSRLFRIHAKEQLHHDGWLDVNVDMRSDVAARRRLEKANDYKQNISKNYKLSELRLRYLIDIINLLDKYGDVYLVRLPVHRDFNEIEDGFVKDFEGFLKLAIDASDGYLDFSTITNSYEFTDGHHLTSESAEQVSMEIALWIKERENVSSGGCLY